MASRGCRAVTACHGRRLLRLPLRGLGHGRGRRRRRNEDGPGVRPQGAPQRRRPPPRPGRPCRPAPNATWAGASARPHPRHRRPGQAASAAARAMPMQPRQGRRREANGAGRLGGMGSVRVISGSSSAAVGCACHASLQDGAVGGRPGEQALQAATRQVGIDAVREACEEALQLARRRWCRAPPASTRVRAPGRCRPRPAAGACPRGASGASPARVVLPAGQRPRHPDRRLQRGGELGAGLEALVAVLGQRACEHRVHRWRQAGLERAGRRRRVADDLRG